MIVYDATGPTPGYYFVCCLSFAWSILIAFLVLAVQWARKKGDRGDKVIIAVFFTVIIIVLSGFTGFIGYMLITRRFEPENTNIVEYNCTIITSQGSNYTVMVPLLYENDTEPFAPMRETTLTGNGSLSIGLSNHSFPVNSKTCFVVQGKNTVVLSLSISNIDYGAYSISQQPYSKFIENKNVYIFSSTNATIIIKSKYGDDYDWQEWTINTQVVLGWNNVTLNYDWDSVD